MEESQLGICAIRSSLKKKKTTIKKRDSKFYKFA